MIKLITLCTCSLSSQYGRSSAYLCRKLFWSIVEWYLRVKQCMVGTWREHE